MKSIIIVAVALVAVAVAAPPELAQTLRSEYNQNPEGSYNFGFETDQGIVRQEQGDLKQVPDADNKPHDVVVVRGSFSYIDNEGKSETINYIADENGYRAEGPSVPKAPARR